jgi:hypothetical protein
MTKHRDAFDFSASASERRRQDRAWRSLERERKRRLAAAVKRSKRDAMRQRKEQKRLEAKRKKDEQHQRQADDKRLRAERKRWNKPPRQRRRGDDLQTAIRLFGLFGSVLNRVDKNKQAELIAYADEHMAEIYEAPVQDPPAEKKAPGFFGRALQGLRNLVGA